MIRINQSIVVNRPADVVFAFVAAFEHEPRWRSEIREMRVSPKPVAIGSRVTEVMSVLGRDVLTTVEVTELRPSATVTARFVSGPLPIDLTYAVTPAPGGAAARFMLDIDVSRWPLVSRLDRLWSAIAGVYYGRQLRTLKRMLESG